MRKIILVMVSLLVPFGLWTAGCRKNQQAAFPKSPEMKGLARAPEQQAPTRAPVIPPAPIDRDILNLPEQTTMARINAVNDRSEQLAGPRANPGLFVLPEEGQGEMASAARAGDPGMAPIPSGREFWSKPAAMPAGSRSLGSAPHGVSAMAPAAPAPQYDNAAAPLPKGSGFMPPPPSGRPATPAYAPPAPYAAPPQPFEPMLLPEDIPGVFMDTDMGPLSMAPKQPPIYYASPVYSAQPGFSGTAEFIDFKGDALGAPPLSSNEFDSGFLASAGYGEPEPEGVKLDLSGLIGSMREVADIPAPAAMPMAALPEPVPFVETPGVAAVPDGMPSATPAPLAAVPAPAAIPAFDASDIRQALAPLPDITALPASPASVVMARESPQVIMPPPMPEPLPPPDMMAAKAALLDYTPEPREGAPAPKPLSSDEFFQTSFWEKSAPPAAPTMPAPLPAPPPAAFPGADLLKSEIDLQAGQAAAFPAIGVREVEIPEFKFEAVPLPAPTLGKPETAGADEPQKVTLQPMRRSRLKNAGEMRDIDSAAEAPPLRF